FLPIKSREQIARKQSFRRPDWPTPRGPLEPDARHKHLQLRLPPQVRRRDVLVLQLRPQAKPRQPRLPLVLSIRHYPKSSAFCHQHSSMMAPPLEIVLFPVAEQSRASGGGTNNPECSPKPTASWTAPAKRSGDSAF